MVEEKPSEEKATPEKTDNDQDKLPSAPPNNSNGSGDASSSSNGLLPSSSATRRTATESLVDNNSSDPKQPKLSNTIASSEGNGSLSILPVPPPPLTGLFEVFQNLPQQVVRQMEELRQDLNRDQLMEQIDSMMDEATLARFEPLFQDKQAGRTGLVKLLHWLSSLDSGEARESVENFRTHLVEFQNWLEGQNLTSTCGGNPPQQQQSEATWLEVMGFLWEVGPLSFWRLGWLIHDLRIGGLLDRTLQAVTDLRPNLERAMQEENLQRVIIPAVANWMLEQDREELRERLIGLRGRLRQVLDWMEEQGL